MKESLLSKYKLNYEYMEDDARLMKMVRQRIKQRKTKLEKRRAERLSKKNDRQ